MPPGPGVGNGGDRGDLPVPATQTEKPEARPTTKADRASRTKEEGYLMNRTPIDWNSPNWGGQVHEDSHGSHLDAEVSA